MISEIVNYTIKKANSEEIHKHLLACCNNFYPPLNETVDLREYSNKIFEKAITFEAWNDSSLIGLLAAYFDDVSKSAFVTNVSVLGDKIKSGVASQLIIRLINYAISIRTEKLFLKVNSRNERAISLYKKFHFQHINTNGYELEMELFI